MGSVVQSLNEEDLRNCINLHDPEGIVKVREQYDSHGNIMYYYKLFYETLTILKLEIYNPDNREIGSIVRTQDCCSNFYYSINDENKNVLYYMTYKVNCCSIVYSFLDLNKNLEGFIEIRNKCSYIILEEFDKYNTKIGECNHKCYDNFPIYTVSDINGGIVYKCKRFIGEKGNNLFKIFDSYDHEVNFDNKSLLNRGFTKMQIVIFFMQLNF